MSTGLSCINGEWLLGEGASFVSHEPYSGHSCWSGHESSLNQVDIAMRSARKQQAAWAMRSYIERLQILQQFSALVKERHAEFTFLLARESGKVLWEAAAEIDAVAHKINSVVEAHDDRVKKDPIELDGYEARQFARALGVVVVIGPFNFPAHLPNGQIIPALLMGNTVVFKPSEHCPGVAEYLVRLFHESGVPVGCLQLIHGGAKQVMALVDHKYAAAVSFTGSYQVGVALHKRLAGRPHVLLSLEMGGNNPLIVWDCPLSESLLQSIILSAYVTAGQRCTCARRIIVPRGQDGDDLIGALAYKIRALQLGDPLGEDAVFYGPLISSEACENALAFQQKLIEEDAIVHKAMTAEDTMCPSILTPGLLEIDSQHMPDEECFAPLLLVQRASSFERAIEKANATSYGLAAALFTPHEDLWHQFRQDIQAGIVNWNRQTTGANGRLPFGGLGKSGNHRPAGSRMIDHTYQVQASLTAPNLPEEKEIPGL